MNCSPSPTISSSITTVEKLSESAPAVWLVDLGMAAKVRPCLVISIPAGETERALVTLVPHTTSLRGTRFECVLPVAFLKSGAFDVQGLVTVPHAGNISSDTRAG